MDIRAIEMGIYNYRAAKAFTKFQKGTLPKEGVIKCPRSIILNCFHKDCFYMLCQTDNKTYYKLKVSSCVRNA